MRQKIIALLLAALCALSLCNGCAAPADAPAPEDGRVKITIAYTSQLNSLEAFVEEQFPDVDLQWEFIVSLGSEIKRRMAAGQGPDLVLSTQPADQENTSYVLPLDGYAFSTRYESTMLKNLFVQERLYYLPMPGQYNGFVINKTLFDEAGLPLPDTNEAFINALLTMRELGLGVSDTGHMFGLRETGNVTLGTFVTACLIPDFLGTVEGARWLADFENREAVMTGTWEPAFALAGELLAHDLMNVTMFSRQGNTFNNAIYMAEGKLAAAYGSSAFLEESRTRNAQMVKEGKASAYEYMMLPLFGTEGTPNWTLALPNNYIGINAALAQDEAKLDACLRVMDALSTQEGQAALMKDLLLDNSYLKEFTREEQPIPDGLETVVQGGYVYYAKFPGKVIEYLGSQVAQYLGGKKSAAECLAAVDEYHLHGSLDVEQDLSIVGSLAQSLIYENYNTRLGETALGNLVADSVAALSGAPIAVVNGGGIRASLYEGDVLGEDLKAACPYDNQITVVRITGDVLWAMLENGLSALHGVRENIPGGRFLQVSGIRYTYDSTKPVGERMVSACLADGTPIDPEATYTVAINDYMTGTRGYLEGNGDGYTMLNLYSDDAPRAQGVTLLSENGGTYREALRHYFAQCSDGPVTVAVEGRIVDIGAARAE